MLIYAILDISAIYELLLFDLYNILGLLAIYYDDNFSLCQYLEKFLIEGYSFDNIGSIVKYYAP